MKKSIYRPAFLCFVAFIVTLMLAAPAMAAGSNYSDVSPESPWKKGIEYVTENGISTGTGDNCFSPDSPITVCQWSTMLCRAFGKNDAHKEDNCCAHALYNNWISTKEAANPHHKIVRGRLYESAFSVINIPFYDLSLYPNAPKGNTKSYMYVYLATKFGICEEVSSPTEYVSRGEAADLIYKMATREYTVEPPPILSECPIVNKSNTDITPFAKELMRVPQPILKLFKEKAWKYVIDFDYIQAYGQQNNANFDGLCHYTNHCIYISGSSATLHEFGHFLNYSQGWPSVVTHLYSTEANAARAFLRPYAMTNHLEYYADYFAHFINYKNNPSRVAEMQELTPLTYSYFSNLASNNWGCP